MTSTGINEKTGKATYLLHKRTLPHKGIRPTRLFRKGLRRIIEQNLVVGQIEEKIFGGKK
jgi:hypothetical protein